MADARRFVTADRKAYDVIVADLFHPSRDGAGYLYTLEHFQAVKRRLAPGGIFCQWLPIYQLDLPVFKTIVRTFLDVFPEGSAVLAHFSLTNPIVGLVSGVRSVAAGPQWIEHRVDRGALRERLSALHLNTAYDLLGCYLADAVSLQRFAGPGPLNTDDRPVVLFEAPRFVYAKQGPASQRLIVLINALHAHAGDVLEDAASAVQRERLEKYWAARDYFIRAGLEVPQTRDLRQLLGYVRELLLETIRVSPDFDAAYRPLLAMARQLSRVDPQAGKALLNQLIEVNPARPEAKRLLDQIDQR